MHEIVGNIHIDIPSIDFRFYAEDFPERARLAARSDWDKAKNKCEYAIKIKEYERINAAMANHLMAAYELSPNAACLNYLIAHLLIKRGIPDTERILEYLKIACKLADRSHYWLSLAAFTDQHAMEGITCYAFRRYFMIEGIPPQATAEWIRFSELIAKHRYGRALIAVLLKVVDGELSSEKLSICTATVAYFQNPSLENMFDPTTPLEGQLNKQEILAILGKSSTDVSNDVLTAEQIFDSSVQDSIALPALLASNAPGRIEKFSISEGYGFLERSDGLRLHFHVNDIDDADLRRLLFENPESAEGISVVFDEKAAGQFNTAERIQRLTGTYDLILRARQNAKNQDWRNALTHSHLALRIDPTNLEARQLEREASSHIGDYTSPTDGSSYAKAKWAQVHDEDFGTAERHFRDAIQKGDHVDRALRDLCFLLQQQGRHTEALNLIEMYQSCIPEFEAWLLKASANQTAHKDESAIQCLNRALPITLRADLRLSIWTQLALSFYRLKDLDNAQRTVKEALTLDPTSSAALRLSDAIETTKASGHFESDCEVLPHFSEVESAVTSFSMSFLRKHSYAGFDPQRVREGKFAVEDVDAIINRAEATGDVNAAKRASLYLTAASLLERLPSRTNQIRLIGCLRNFFINRGDFGNAQNVHPDVVRTFYAEALALSTETDGLDILKRYLRTFDGKEAAESSIVNLLKTGLAETKHTRTIIDSLLYLSIRSSWAANVIIGTLYSLRVKFPEIPRLIGVVQSASEAQYRKAWESKRQQLVREFEHTQVIFRSFSRSDLNATTVEDMLRQMGNNARPTLELDAQRFRKITGLLEYARNFVRATTFDDSESNFKLITTREQDLRTDCEVAPTRCSQECVISFLDHLRDAVSVRFDRIIRDAEPKLSIDLAVREYIRNSSNAIVLQFTISNQAGSSTARDVQLTVCDSPWIAPMASNKLGTKQDVRGGSKLDIQLPVTLSPGVGDNLTFDVVGTFRNRADIAGSFSAKTLSILLKTGSQFIGISSNPYAPYAEGGPVNDPHMFFGRKELIESVASAIERSHGSKCIVLYGQKRAGKSSILEHLRRRLADSGNSLPVSIDLHGLSVELTEELFLHSIMRHMALAIEERMDCGAPPIPFHVPPLKDFHKYRTLVFHETLANFLRACRYTEGWRNVRIVLLLDEFTEIYKQILKRKVSPEFMKMWKAFLEKCYFSAVLVGQDIMPAFKMRFPNEFGVVQDERVTYLSESDARQLIQQPIGENRFAGGAVSKLLELTACSPYYAMMLCNRLVEYINRNKSVVVTEADIEQLKLELIRGHNPLTEDKFHPLLLAVDEKFDSEINPEMTLHLCQEIAKHSDDLGWCWEHNLDLTALGAQKALDDLYYRGVVERADNKLKISVGLFREWLFAKR